MLMSMKGEKVQISSSLRQKWRNTPATAPAATLTGKVKYSPYITAGRASTAPLSAPARRPPMTPMRMEASKPRSAGHQWTAHRMYTPMAKGTAMKSARKIDSCKERFCLNSSFLNSLVRPSTLPTAVATPNLTSRVISNSCTITLFYPAPIEAGLFKSRSFAAPKSSYLRLSGVNLWRNVVVALRIINFENLFSLRRFSSIFARRGNFVAILYVLGCSRVLILYLLLTLFFSPTFLRGQYCLLVVARPRCDSVPPWCCFAQTVPPQTPKYPIPAISPPSNPP